WNQPFKPFRIIGNIHYVGTNNLACYLITSPGGHILIDTGMQESAPIVQANIEALGYKLKYVRIILSSHAHFDHVAGHADMKAATGAQVFATAADALTLESGGAKGFHPLNTYKPVKVDRIIKDGEIVRLGGIALTAHLTPGHTEGNTTWTTTVEENAKKYDVVFVGSMSINPGVRMVNNPTWPKIAEAYAKSFQTLRSLHCDVFLGPHAPFFNMEAKVKRMNADPKTNPFIDRDGYHNYIAAYEKSYNEQLQRERAGK
ncbi:MAG: subclass B3 metallo-beta-lactamase, partial [Acidobacteriota bacterium]|nr:subclass B3 metallo-beta-lactamase [Acidobacteriota bacterium]